MEFLLWSRISPKAVIGQLCVYCYIICGIKNWRSTFMSTSRDCLNQGIFAQWADMLPLPKETILDRKIPQCISWMKKSYRIYDSIYIFKINVYVCIKPWKNIYAELLFLVAKGQDYGPNYSETFHAGEWCLLNS